MQADEVLRLALGTRDQLVQVWTVDPNFQLKAVFVKALQTTIPKAVALVDNAARDVRVYGMLDGRL